jgi:8-oxo-dGTP pyrophosphatase MutT (NUDIX family)
MTTLRATLALVDAAVLVPVYRAPDERLRLVFVRKMPGGRHGGQIAFPGGRREATDASLLRTALREAEEEVGLGPDAVTILAELPLVDTMTTGFRVAPFLGRLAESPETWQRQESEIAEILDVPVEELEKSDEGAFYRIGPHKLWGLTFRIVEPLLPRLQAGEWDI